MRFCVSWRSSQGMKILLLYWLHYITFLEVELSRSRSCKSEGNESDGTNDGYLQEQLWTTCQITSPPHLLLLLLLLLLQLWLAQSSACNRESWRNKESLYHSYKKERKSCLLMDVRNEPDSDSDRNTIAHNFNYNFKF